MAEGNIRHVALARLGDGLLIASYTTKNAPSPSKISDAVSRVLESGNLSVNQRISISIDKVVGNLHVLTTNSEIFLGVFSASYPRKPAFEMLEHVSTHTKEYINKEQMAKATKEGELTRSANQFFKDTCNRFEAAGVNKIAQIGMKVEEVKAVMEQNINRVLQNAEDLESVETKSEILRQDAQQFQRRGENIKRALWWRNFKLKCIIALLIIVILLYIFLPIISKQM